MTKKLFGNKKLIFGVIAGIIVICLGIMIGAIINNQPKAANYEANSIHKLSNPNANETTQAVYAYLCKTFEEKKMLSGQQESTWMSSTDYEMDIIEAATGKLPAIRGFDYMNNDYDGVNKRAIEWWNEGGLVTICWHTGLESSGYEESKADNPDFDKLFTEGTQEYETLMKTWDIAATHLQELQDAGVTVIWRPFHEFDGQWFWWGKCGSENFIKLWRWMYDKFTNEYELNNLIWVLGYSDKVKSGWYVGDEYCDIVGSDNYHDYTNFSGWKKLTKVESSNKPYAFHECSNLPTIKEFEDKGCDWLWFMNWHTEWLTCNTDEQLKEIYCSEKVITRDELPYFNEESAIIGEKGIVTKVNGQINTEIVSFHTETQTKALVAGKDKLLAYAYGTAELSRPQGITVSWKALSKLDRNGSTEILQGYTLKYSEIDGEDGLEDNVISIELKADENAYTFFNQKLGESYSYEVVANYSNGTHISSGIVKFTVEDVTPRNLYVDGVANVRDIGGWTTTDGKSVKQGLVIRGGRLNDDKKETVSVTEAGIETLVKELGIRTELDLRQDEIRTQSALGMNVNYINIPMPGTVTTQLRKHDEDIKKVIKVFANEQNYPIYLHCSIGTDRTGLITFLINGLLGVSEDDLYLDYAFSNFGKIGSMRDYKEIQEKYVKVIKGFEGDSLQEKIENYLLEIGINEEEIATIRRILGDEK